MTKLILAPMAATSCTTFRLLCKKYGADVIYTQMYHVKDLVEISKTKDVTEYLNIKPEEHPITIQLIGGLKDPWEEAIKLVENLADKIDINLGCPESEMLERRCGSYLLNQPEQIRKIIQQVKQTTNKSITAKIRSGWKTNNYLEIGKILEEEGIEEIAIHPRTKVQMYTGKADWNAIKELKQNLKIPVIGNGDINLPGHAKSMLEQTKCDGIMIGRTAIKNPAIFFDIKYLLENQKNNPNPISKQNQIKDFLKIQKEVEPNMSLNQIKDHCAWIASDLPNSKEVKERIRECNSVNDIWKIIS